MGDIGGTNESLVNMPTIKFTKLFINGQFVDSISGKTLETIDPRNGEVIARVAEGDKEDIDLAVKAARAAFDHGPWPRMSGTERGKIMMKFADLISQNVEELATLDSLDAGKLFSVGKSIDIPGAAATVRYYAGAADKVHGEVLKMSRPLHGYTLLEPIGVVGHIIPWNFPSTMFSLKVSPCLAAGCTMIVKPAEQTPLSALYYAHLAKLAGIPDGVLNVITGFGPTAGAAISSHMDIDKVSFTGSGEVGREIMKAAAASNLKQVSLELGGKSPIIIFDDADIEMASELALMGILFNKGEVCVATSRLYVQEGIYDELVKKLVEKAKAWAVGDPFNPEVRQGPQVDKRQFEKILSYIEQGKKEGATLLTGGNRVGDTGYYIQPTIFADTKEDMQIVKDEIFGPVLALMKFKTVEEAIERANKTRYGLAAVVVTNNLNVANTVSRSVRAGSVWINCYLAIDNDCPFGGYKMSGFGKDFGMDALHKYLQVKAVICGSPIEQINPQRYISTYEKDGSINVEVLTAGDLVSSLETVCNGFQTLHVQTKTCSDTTMELQIGKKKTTEMEKHCNGNEPPPIPPSLGNLESHQRTHVGINCRFEHGEKYLMQPGSASVNERLEATSEKKQGELFSWTPCVRPLLESSEKKVSSENDLLPIFDRGREYTKQKHESKLAMNDSTHHCGTGYFMLPSRLKGISSTIHARSTQSQTPPQNLVNDMSAMFNLFSSQFNSSTGDPTTLTIFNSLKSMYSTTTPQSSQTHMSQGSPTHSHHLAAQPDMPTSLPSQSQHHPLPASTTTIALSTALLLHYSFDVKMPTIKFTKLFINGEFVDSVSGKTFETIDPRNGEVIARVAEGDKEDIDLAVKAARAAFDHGPWPRMSGSERARIMMKFADLIDENIEELASMDCRDGGKLFSVGKAIDIPNVANTLRYYAGAADKIHGEVLKMSTPFHAYTLLEPIGVVGHIIPWNFPSTMFFTKVSPALAAGCTMLIKPAEQTPLSALFYAHLAKLAGIPDGVLNVVNGYGHTAGAAISSHMDIDKVSFTGSGEIGREVMKAAAASNLKPVSLELGGKSPLIIFDDADLEMASELALVGILFNKGEICVASSRVYVQEGIYDELVNKLVEKAKAWSVGDPFDPQVRQGPQVDKTQFDKILRYIEHGKREGATLLTGGKPIGDKGYYIEPTIFTNVTEEMLIVKDEIFGPVMALMKFKSMDEAIKCANNSRYGLAAGVLTKNLDIANTVSRSIRAGTIWINCYFAFNDDCPFGGYKMSGFGKDLGLDALHKYLQVKSVVTPLYNSPWL
ncbi:hypothetical protein F8388_012817 [Cannabis sativa]|uniref:Aldehyde dehydrogenase 1 n=1 Tax=Cannabis sativa TaxID=3483 RepID=A0A7J6F404_CANSA|nr:hypothetical protein F8388_012817 [Cannabis sativa]